MESGSSLIARRSDYRDSLIELLTDLEAAQLARWRLERALLLDLANQLRAELAQLRLQLEATRAELRRYSAAAIGVAA